MREMELLFSRPDLRAWLETRMRSAQDQVQRCPSEEVLARPPEQLAAEVVERYLVEKPFLDLGAMTGQVGDQAVDVSGDRTRAIFGSNRSSVVPGTRISYHIPYRGPVEALRLRASRFSHSPPSAVVGTSRVSIFWDVPADRLERDREKVIERLRREAHTIDEYLGYARTDIGAWNENLRQQIPRGAEARRKKILADRDTEAILGVPLNRNERVAQSYAVQPVKRKRVTPVGRATPREAFAPEPAITDDDFRRIIGDIASICRLFERLAMTYADADEESLRDQILAMLGNVYGPTTGESFSRRGKSDIYLPWDGGHPVFLAECKWWSGPKAFAEDALPQLLDRYVVWRDTHAAMVLFIKNKDATAVISKAIDAIRTHHRYVRDGSMINDVPVFVLHKDGDPDREVALALVAAPIHA